jgi:hypothetical protein
VPQQLRTPCWGSTSAQSVACSSRSFSFSEEPPGCAPTPGPGLAAFLSPFSSSSLSDIKETSSSLWGAMIGGSDRETCVY